jgi:predicted CoA-binding protein
MKKMIINETEKIIDIVKKAKTVAIVGISTNSTRPSYQITNKIQERYQIFLVNPRYNNKTIFGKPVHASLKDINKKIDIVDVFRNPLYTEEIFKDAIQTNSKVIWLQPGSENKEVIDKYKDKINIIYNHCLGVISNLI